jgi:hypothetical protein
MVARGGISGVRPVGDERGGAPVDLRGRAAGTRQRTRAQRQRPRRDSRHEQEDPTPLDPFLLPAFLFSPTLAPMEVKTLRSSPSQRSRWHRGASMPAPRDGAIAPGCRHAGTSGWSDCTRCKHAGTSGWSDCTQVQACRHLGTERLHAVQACRHLGTERLHPGASMPAPRDGAIAPRCKHAGTSGWSDCTWCKHAGTSRRSDCTRCRHAGTSGRRAFLVVQAWQHRRPHPSSVCSRGG